ncbi:MAG TPA: hypothetical protein DCG72_08930 [Gammaproteobacteria bacterium]|nr:hypothetical protein [Gammaproteobacteria bacterium]
MSELRADTITSATDNTDLEIQARGTGVPNLESGFKVGGTAGLPVSELRSGTDGELITWDASGNPTTVAVGTASQVLTSNGAGAAPTFQTLSTGPTELTQQSIVLNSTSTEFTGIASGARFVVLSAINFAANSAAWGPAVQIGDSGGFETSGYNGNSTNGDATTYAWSAAASCGEPNGLNSGDDLNVTWICHHVTGNSWCISCWGSKYSPSNKQLFGQGFKQLSGELDRIRFTSSSGADTFAAQGNVHVFYW